MSGNNLFSVIFIFVCILLTAKGDECVYDDSGLCISSCPSGMYSYSPGCNEQTMSQRTCRQPLARAIGTFCDYSRCDCPKPKVLDEVTKKCVLIQNCSDQSSL